MVFGYSLGPPPQRLIGPVRVLLEKHEQQLSKVLIIE